MSWRSPEPCRHGSTAPHPRGSDPGARRQTLCDFDRRGVARSELHDATRASLVSAFPGELARGRELRHDRANSDSIWRHGVSWATHCPPLDAAGFWRAGRLPPPRTSSVAVPGASHGGGRSLAPTSTMRTRLEPVHVEAAGRVAAIANRARAG